tara:strand:- start:186 stop:908 length:723 start_codon:yes stop_codon:yes gene_type:complete
MKVIILCAGLGSRLHSDQPKGFIQIEGKTILENCVQNFLKYKIKKKNIFFATGFKKNLIKNKFGKKFSYSFNKKFRNTNMVYTLFNTLKKITNTDILISYSDIIYDKKNILKLLKDKNNISTLIDFKWKKMWKKKNKLYSDSESLKIINNKIIELGKSTRNINKIDGRYVGVIKISKKVLPEIKKLYKNLLNKNQNKFKNIDMTNFLNLLIQKKYEITPIKLVGKWNEYDDYTDLNFKYK